MIEDKKTISALESILFYLQAEEKKHWQESGRPKEHIYHSIKELANFLDKERNGKNPMGMKEWRERIKFELGFEKDKAKKMGTTKQKFAWTKEYGEGFRAGLKRSVELSSYKN